MIRERITPGGKVRYMIEVRVDGQRHYGYTHTRQEAEAKEQAFKQRRRGRGKKIDSTDFLRRAWR